MSVQDIIDKLTVNAGKFDNMVYVGKNYSKAELIADLKTLLHNDEDE